MPVYFSPHIPETVTNVARKATGFDGRPEVIVSLVPLQDEVSFLEMAAHVVLPFFPLLLARKALIKQLGALNQVIVIDSDKIWVRTIDGQKWHLGLEDAKLVLKSSNDLRPGDEPMGTGDFTTLEIHFQGKDESFPLFVFWPEFLPVENPTLGLIFKYAKLILRYAHGKAQVDFPRVITAFNELKYQNHLIVEVLNQDSTSQSYWLRISAFNGLSLKEDFEWQAARLLSESLHFGGLAKHRDLAKLKLLVRGGNEATKRFLNEPKLDLPFALGK
jgi:hypothetical protein